ncbi:MAG: hypothetical protein J6Z79_04380, partial [Clostridia bacterium]|nr:hypothetical protein [Clostridia bacterium]
VRFTYHYGGLIHENRIFCLPKDAFFNPSRRKEAWYVISRFAAVWYHGEAVYVITALARCMLSVGLMPYIPKG